MRPEELSQSESLAKYLADEHLIYSQLFLFAPDPIVIENSEGLVVFASSRISQMFGYQSEEVVGHPLRKIVDLTMSPAWRSSHEISESSNIPGISNSEGASEASQVADCSDNFDGVNKVSALGKIKEALGTRKDGSVFPLEISQSVIQFSDRICTLYVLRDTTRLWKITDAIWELNVRHTAALRASGIGIWDWDLETKVLQWSEENFKLFGVDSNDIRSPQEIWQSALHHEDSSRVVSAVESALSGRGGLDLEYRIVLPNAEIRWLHSLGDVLLDGGGKPIRMTGVRRDVTKRNRQISELKAKRDALVVSNQDLELFTFAASHDLNEPLRKIISFLEVLSSLVQAPKGSETDQVFNRISNAAARMQILIADLLKYSRAGRKDVADELVNLKTFVADIIEEVGAGSSQHNSIITIGNLPIISVKKFALYDVLRNLIENAFKFVRKDVPLELEVGSRARDGVCEIWVKDNGIGIDAKYFEKIFVIFTKLHGRSVYQGTGVGLAMCKRTLEKMGGAIAVESTVGCGSTFTVTLPLKSAKLAEN